MIVDAPFKRGRLRWHTGRWPLSKHGNSISELDVCSLARRNSSGRDVCQQDDVFIRQAVGNLRKVGLGIGNQDVLGLTSINGVSKFPAAETPTALGPLPGKAELALAARCDCANEDALACCVTADSRS
jgi:hypothetical protein